MNKWNKTSDGNVRHTSPYLTMFFNSLQEFFFLAWKMWFVTALFLNFYLHSSVLANKDTVPFWHFSSSIWKKTSSWIWEIENKFQKTLIVTAWCLVWCFWPNHKAIEYNCVKRLTCYFLVELTERHHHLTIQIFHWFFFIYCHRSSSRPMIPVENCLED